MAIKFYYISDGYKTRKDVEKVATNYVKIVKVDGGWAAFETWTDYETWKNQK